MNLFGLFCMSKDLTFFMMQEFSLLHRLIKSFSFAQCKCVLTFGSKEFIHQILHTMYNRFQKKFIWNQSQRSIGIKNIDGDQYQIFKFQKSQKMLILQRKRQWLLSQVWSCLKKKIRVQIKLRLRMSLKKKRKKKYHSLFKKCKQSFRNQDQRYSSN